MPVISRFYGIIIAMYFNDHNPPHLHAKYAGQEAIFAFDGTIISGKLPVRAVNIIDEWISAHRMELLENWHRAQCGKPLNKIKPLE